MGRAIANATNAAQGWREPAPAQLQPQQEPVTMNKMGQSKGKSGCCFPTGNSHRSGNDDGSQQTRQMAGGMSMKHHSHQTHANMKGYK